MNNSKQGWMDVLWMLLVMIGAMALHGYVLSRLWTWFVVPVFAWPVLSWKSATGLRMVAKALRAVRVGERKTSSSVDYPFSIYVHLVTAALALILGYGLHLWMAP